MSAGREKVDTFSGSQTARQGQVKEQVTCSSDFPTQSFLFDCDKDDEQPASSL